MKKLFLSICLVASFATAQAELPALTENVFTKNTTLVNGAIGIGTLANSTTFGQHFGMEWGIVDGWLDNRASLGVGFSIDNVACGNYVEFMYGTYDYYYPIYGKNLADGDRHNSWEQVNKGHREGVGSTWATVSQDNLAFMANCSFHYQFIDKLDTYFTLGFGFAVNFRSYDYWGTEGFEEKSYESTSDTKHPRKWSYNDYDHVVWNKNGSNGTGASFAMTSTVGARYYFTDNWAAKAELGMIGGAFPTWGPGLSVLTLGVTYRFK